MMALPSTQADQRLQRLDGYGILDTAPEEGYDDIVRLASRLCATPVALVSFVARDRQWFKARVGFPLCETDLHSSVCAHALDASDLLVIPDLTKDARTLANPLVTGEPHIRFYAGAPLRTPDGQAIGSLCVIDMEPRPTGLTAEQSDDLRALARQVMGLLELRAAGRRLSEEVSERVDTDRRRTALLELGDRLRDLTSVPEMTWVAAEIVGRTLGASRVGFGRLDAAAEHVDIEPDWTIEGVASIAGRHRFADYGDLRHELLKGRALVIDDVRTDPRTARNPEALLEIGVAALVNMPVRDKGRTIAVFIVHDIRPRPWSAEVLAFLRNVADRVEVGVARVQAEERQRVLNGELSHRLKNTLTMVQAIATQTLRNVVEREPINAFEKRLHALATAHDVLLDQNWVSAPMKAVVTAVLGTFGQPARFDIRGADVTLGARATMSLSLLLHELATNAFKYGALSNGTGTVRVAWRRTDTDADLVLDWIETGGPPVREPDRKGFGSKLIRMGLVGTGGVVLRYPETGFEAEMSAPLVELQHS